MADDTKKPSKDFSTRYKLAGDFRDQAEPRLKEILSFVCPGRESDFDTNDTNPVPREDDEETFSSMPEDLASDFAADLMTYYTPSESVWTEYEVTAPVPEEAAVQVMELVSAREQGIAELITASNYYDVAPQVLFEAAHGTMAMWVEQSALSQPIYVENVPPHELKIVPGHQGILDRFREKMVPANTLEAVFKDTEVDLSDESIKRAMKRPDQYVKVCWGFWVDWSDPGNPVWKHEATVMGKRVTPKEPIVLGPIAGTCPLLVGRFNPQSGKPWGRGPGWKALPDMRVYDAIKEGVLDGIDQALRNTLIYADDGFIDVENGIMPGSAIPASRGFTRDQIYELGKDTNLDPGFFTEDRIEQRLRECFFQDGPRQSGDTPPTATQWVDERRRVQIRIGKPSAPLWREFFLPFIQRIEYIGIETGKFDGPLTHQGDVIDVQPVSPLQKATNQDKVLVSRSNLDMLAGVFGDAMVQVVDLEQTSRNIVDASGDELTVIRKAEQNGGPPPADS